MVPIRKRCGRRVWFSDEVAGGLLVEVFEVESFKEFNKEACRLSTVQTELGADDKQWCDDLLRKLNGSDIETRTSALVELEGLILVLSLLPEGSDVVLRALDVARCGWEQRMLATELRGHVRELADSPYGNEVLQSCLEVMKPDAVSFIPQELVGVAASVASHEHGSGVLCRLIEHLPAHMSSSLIKEVLQHCASLSQNEFGNVVIQHILEYGSPLQQSQIYDCQALADELPNFNWHCSSNSLLHSAPNAPCENAPARVQPKSSINRNTIQGPVVVPPPVTLYTLRKGYSSAKDTGLKDTTPKDYDFAPVGPMTTLMIRGIPCSYTQEKMLEILDAAGLQGRYDFFYLPRRSHQSNLGYAFVNFVDMRWTEVCYVKLNGKSLDAMRSKKVCTVSPAHIQGLKDLSKHFRHSWVSKSSGRGPVFPDVLNAGC
eukprot:gnl/MRDRNA2_/MRDRNA2_135380_c0_seq1.p1 gnl/MRDRNA2_/MRDRNA2_135380_c0~~gnl/MRDRNA2_/MRDRNA2_135380_c0_seq1.p1  ORF type:complete len:464 (-),score=63.90 gnl/MRDRNA2_/MRDRNA2_135380_c0_seq1:116-1408(-)